MKPHFQLPIPQHIYLPQGTNLRSGQNSGGGAQHGRNVVTPHAGNSARRYPVRRNAAMAAGLRSQLPLISEPPLVTAIRMGDWNEFNRLLTTPETDVNQTSSEGITPLMMTVSKKNLVAMRILLDCNGININMRNLQGDTTLHLAAQAGQVDQVGTLLDDRRIAANMKNAHGNSALCLAAQQDHYQVVELLLRHQLVNQRMPKNPTDEYLKAYRFAADNNGFKSIIILLRVNPWLKNALRSDGHTALTSAIKARRRDVVQTLLKKYPDIDVDLAGEGLGTALNVAVEQRNVEMVLTLLRHCGLNPNRPVNTFDRTVLHQASARGDANIVQVLMSALPVIDVDAVTQSLHTPLHLAGFCGDAATLRVLARWVADINQMDEDGKTVLHFAAASGNIEAVQFLLQLADIDSLAQTNIGHSPTDIAIQFGHFDVAQILHDAEFQRLFPAN